MWKDTLMSIINDIKTWIDTVIFRNKTKTSNGKKAKKNNVKIETKPKSTRGSIKKPRTKKPTKTRSSSKPIKK